MDPNNQGPPGGGGFFQGGPGGGGRFVGPGGPMVHRAFSPEFLIGTIVLIVLIVLLVALFLYVLYRISMQSSGGWGRKSAAVHELEMRYARGEIGRDEFLLRRHDLTSGAGKILPPAPPGAPAAAPPPSAGTPPPPAPPAQGAQAAS
ncbi:MAG TPA: hypothetical protein VNV65_01730 [Candidatus Solibacter sp.]|jgi:putative membrane protein|nr:hypothetical protein [Candidatus Solibacter sp.]